MKLVINIILLALILVLGYLLISGIREPIKFKAEKDLREKAVQEKLETIRTAQQCYMGITGKYAHTFDTLREVLQSDSFEITKVFGDPDDPTGQKVFYETSFVMANDSIQKLGIDLATLSYVPYTDNEPFELTAKEIIYQSTTVPVVKVQTPVSKFMGNYADARYKSYDKFYNPDDPTEKNYYIGFGDLTKPSTAGTWN